jgi:hypothetical protein
MLQASNLDNELRLSPTPFSTNKTASKADLGNKGLV